MNAGWRWSGLGLTVATLTVFVIVSALIVGVVYWRTSTLVARHSLEIVLAEADRLSMRAARDGMARFTRWLRARNREPLIHALADPSGRPIFLGKLSEWPKALASDSSSAVFRFKARTSAGATGSARRTAIGVTVRLPGGQRLLVARDISEQQRAAAEIKWWFLGGTALMALLAMAAGLAISRMMSERLTSMTTATDRIMRGDLSQRLPMAGANDEFDQLAANVNRMLARIEELMAGLKEVSDNIAHDLKTPLNRMRIRAEQALRDPRGDAACREGLEETLVAADELIRTFNALLQVARLEAGSVDENPDVFDIADLVRNVVEFYEPLAEDANASLTAKVGEPLVLSANRQLISQAVTNLIENALKYGLASSRDNQAGGRVEVELRHVDDVIEIRVGDRGAGIAPADRERVLKRFVRLDASRSTAGTGLGLSLVAAVARLHGGEILLQDNGPGLLAVIRLPATRIVDEPKVGGTAQQPSGEAIARSARAATQTT